MSAHFGSYVIGLALTGCMTLSLLPSGALALADTGNCGSTGGGTTTVAAVAVGGPGASTSSGSCPSPTNPGSGGQQTTSPGSGQGSSTSGTTQGSSSGTSTTTSTGTSSPASPACDWAVTCVSIPDSGAFSLSIIQAMPMCPISLQGVGGAQYAGEMIYVRPVIAPATPGGSSCTIVINVRGGASDGLPSLSVTSGTGQWYRYDYATGAWSKVPSPDRDGVYAYVPA